MVRVTLQEGWKLFCFCFSCKTVRNQQDLHFYQEPRGVKFPVAFMHLLSLTMLSCYNVIMLGWHRQTPRKGTGAGTGIFPCHWSITVQTERCLGMCCTHFLCLPHLPISLYFQHKNKAVLEPTNASCQFYAVQMHKSCICFW